MDAESLLKIKGQGDAGRAGGLAGDLYITFLVKASAGMRRRGLDLYSQARNTALGCTQHQAQSIQRRSNAATLHLAHGSQAYQFKFSSSIRQEVDLWEKAMDVQWPM